MKKFFSKFLCVEQLFLMILGILILSLITYIFLYEDSIIFKLSIYSGMLSGSISLLTGLFVAFIMSFKIRDIIDNQKEILKKLDEFKDKQNSRD